MNAASPPSTFRSGFVALIGRPNVGKSTLVNRFVGAKIAIVSPVPQTTRTPARGVVTLPHAQIVVVDTPALHHPRDLLGRWMVDAAQRALADADVIVWLLDARTGLTEEDQWVGSRLHAVSVPIVVTVNKTDRLDAPRLATVLSSVPSLPAVRATLSISAATGTNVDRVVETLAALLPEGPQYFPSEVITDQPEQFLVRELIREQAILATREELPHSLAVEIDEFTPRPAQDLVYIRAVIHVERAAHRKMLIGREGQMVKRIGQAARPAVERLLGTRAYLDLWVKVSEGWREREDLIRRFYPE